MSVILIVGKLKQEDNYKVKASPVYTVSARLVRTM